MKIWIFNPYGNLPGEGWRKYRSTMVGEALAKRGHEVIWWAPNFEHRTKTIRPYTVLEVNSRFTIRILPSKPYKKHVSFERIKFERIFAKNFRDEALKEENNADLLIFGDPSTFHSDIIYQVIKTKKLKFIIDIVDLWPELFAIMLPASLSFISKIFFSPFYWRRAWLLSKAQGLIAVSKDYLKVGERYNSTKHKSVVYWGVDLNEIRNSGKEIFDNIFLKTLSKQLEEIWIIYAGTLGDNYDIKTIIACAKLIEKSSFKIKVLIAGDGPSRYFLENEIAKNQMRKMIYLGRLSGDDLNLLYRSCDMALSSYLESSTVSMPIKAYDYFAAGLPLINSLKRDLGDFVIKYNAGLQYVAEDAGSMFRAIEALVLNEDLRREMSENAFKLAAEFDKEKQYEIYSNVCENVINEIQ